MTCGYCLVPAPEETELGEQVLRNQESLVMNNYNCDFKAINLSCDGWENANGMKPLNRKEETLNLLCKEMRSGSIQLSSSSCPSPD